MAGAFFEVLGHFEVVIRNALNEQLTTWHIAAGRPDAWYDDPGGILDEAPPARRERPRPPDGSAPS